MLPIPAIMALVEQERLDRSPAAPRQAAQQRGRERLIERLDAQARGEERLALRLAGTELAGAERRGSTKQQPAPAVERQLDAGVRGVLARRRAAASGHPQVHQQMDLALQHPVEILAAAAQRAHPSADDRVGQLLGGERRRTSVRRAPRVT